MEDEEWTGVKIGYVCPHCGQQGLQKFTVAAIGYSLDLAKRDAWPQRSACTQCKLALPERLDISLDLVVAPLARLLEVGFPSPLVN